MRMSAAHVCGACLRGMSAAVRAGRRTLSAACWIQSVSASTSLLLTYLLQIRADTIHTVLAVSRPRYSGYGLYQPRVQIRWIRPEKKSTGKRRRKAPPQSGNKRTRTGAEEDGGVDEAPQPSLQRTARLRKNQDLLRSLRSQHGARLRFCLLYTSPSPRDATLSRMPSSA